MTKSMTKAEARRRLALARANIRELELRQDDYRRSLGPSRDKIEALGDAIWQQAHYATNALERAGLPVPQYIADRLETV